MSSGKPANCLATQHLLQTEGSRYIISPIPLCRTAQRTVVTCILSAVCGVTPSSGPCQPLHVNIGGLALAAPVKGPVGHFCCISLQRVWLRVQPAPRRSDRAAKDRTLCGIIGLVELLTEATRLYVGLEILEESTIGDLIVMTCHPRLSSKGERGIITGWRAVGFARKEHLQT
jgi:hypothetical protein